MLPKVTLGQTSVETTPLGFGCARLFRMASGRRRQALLSAAFDHGIRHFDVAPTYGLGLAEEELGRFLKGRPRDSVVIATKFGIEPTPLARLARLQAPARRVVEWFPRLRAPLRTREPTVSGPKRPIDGRTARESLERSLRTLGTAYVDLLLLHEPSIEAVRVADLQEVLEEAREAGLIRAWGIAGPLDSSIQVSQAFRGPVPVLQVPYPLRGRDPLPDRTQTGRIIFGVLSEMVPKIVEHVSAERSRRDRWYSATGIDCTNADAVARLLLHHALDANRGGTVLFSTTAVDRIPVAVSAVSPDQELQRGASALIEVVEAEI